MVRSQVTLRYLVTDSISAEAQSPNTIVTTWATVGVGVAIWKGVGSAAMTGLGSDPGLCWTKDPQAKAREGLPHMFPDTHFLSPV